MAGSERIAQVRDHELAAPQPDVEGPNADGLLERAPEIQAVAAPGRAFGDDPLGGTRASGEVAAALQRRRGQGRPLPQDIAERFGGQLGTDLSGVRVHHDGEADQIARSVQAKAFTYGSDVYFTRGRFDPSSTGGQRLLAHELAHVVQQSQHSGAVSGGPVIGRADDPAEAAADRMADRVVSGLQRMADTSGQISRVPAAVQRNREGAVLHRAIGEKVKAFGRKAVGKLKGLGRRRPRGPAASSAPVVTVAEAKAKGHRAFLLTKLGTHYSKERTEKRADLDTAITNLCAIIGLTYTVKTKLATMKLDDRYTGYNDPAAEAEKKPYVLPGVYEDVRNTPADAKAEEHKYEKTVGGKEGSAASATPDHKYEKTVAAEEKPAAAAVGKYYYKVSDVSRTIDPTLRRDGEYAKSPSFVPEEKEHVYAEAPDDAFERKPHVYAEAPDDAFEHKYAKTVGGKEGSAADEAKEHEYAKTVGGKEGSAAGEAKEHEYAKTVGGKEGSAAGEAKEHEYAKTVGGKEGSAAGEADAAGAAPAPAVPGLSAVMKELKTLAKKCPALGDKGFDDVVRPLGAVAYMEWATRVHESQYVKARREELDVDPDGTLFKNADGKREPYKTNPATGAPIIDDRMVSYDEGPEAQEKTLVTIVGGKLIRSEKSDRDAGKPVDTKESVTHFSGGGYEIFAVGATGDLHMASHKIGKYHHSSLLAGGATAMAGELKVQDGEIKYLSSKSGHYKPTRANLLQFLHWLRKDRVNMDFEVGGFAGGKTEYAKDVLGTEEAGEGKAKDKAYEEVKTAAVLKALITQNGAEAKVTILARTMGWELEKDKPKKGDWRIVDPFSGKPVDPKEVRQFLKKQFGGKVDALMEQNG